MSAGSDAAVIDPVSFSGTPFVQFRPVEASVVLKTIRSMTPTSCDLDPVPTPLLLQCTDDIVPALTEMVNDCFQSGFFPNFFKQAIVKPLLKKHDLDPNQLSSYRPVSNLSFLSKLLEKLVLQQLLEHVSKYDLFARFQSAYRAHHSTETALLRVLNDLLVASDNSKVSVLTLLDLSAAFDTIDHEILLSRLRTVFGIDDLALSLLRSYLSERRQTVWISGFASDPAPLKYGVPQGSVLGPLLFLLYTQPLSNVIDNHSVSHCEFADDTQLYDSSHPSQVQSLLSSTEHCISDVKQWMTQNKLQLNASKTEALLVGGRGESDQALTLTLAQCDIHFSDSVRNLGVMFDDDLSMRAHVNKVCQAAYYELRKISTIRHYLSQQATKTLITSLVLSRLDYGNSLLAGIPDTLLNKLQKVQNCAARLVFRCSKKTHVTPLIHALHWLPVTQRIDYKLATMCFNVINQTAPHALTELVTVYIPSRSLRSAADTRILTVPRRNKKTRGQRAFSYIGPVTWNKLPYSVRHSETPAQFKRSLKTHLFRSAFSSDQ
jgi:retron-type reverse transcriptase